MVTGHRPHDTGQSLQAILAHSQALRQQSERLKREVRALAEKIDRLQQQNRSAVLSPDAHRSPAWLPAGDRDA